MKLHTPTSVRLRLVNASSLLMCMALLGGCRKSHASSQKPWSLEIKKRGSQNRAGLKYGFQKQGWGAYSLDIKVQTHGLRAAERARVQLEIKPRGGGDQGLLEVELVDIEGPGRRSESLVDRSQKIYWEIKASGRTVRFSSEKIDPTLATGLPDFGLLLRRLLPVLPGGKVGDGARWIVFRPMELGLSPMSGSGQMQVSERSDHRLVSLGSERAPVATVETRIEAKYTGLLRVVARRLTMRGVGKGSVKTTIDMN